MATIFLGSLTAAAIYKLVQKWFPAFKERDNAIKYKDALALAIVTVDPTVEPFIPSESENQALTELYDHVFRLKQPRVWSTQKKKHILFVSEECPEKIILFIRRCAQVTPLLRLRAAESEDPNERLKYLAAGFTTAKEHGECVILVEDCDAYFSSDAPVIYNRRVLRQFLNIMDSLVKDRRRITIIAMTNGKGTLQSWFLQRVQLEVKYEKLNKPSPNGNSTSSA
ncbi:unnamed protein product [Bursaphelenchus xylophilus]|uniref:(pine wood nematode) hypothetical protein n=1 Tax=Bursaphelenchus xylophilus TaxID=6326 RepID=A0A1I7S4L7_BURXY|nr:unnamed protein product [Bursaphelenchus xylophilus]CAG9117225.1 unnamed protein product [Bursaphelenchus xylophilus]